MSKKSNSIRNTVAAKAIKEAGSAIFPISIELAKVGIDRSMELKAEIEKRIKDLIPGGEVTVKVGSGGLKADFQIDGFTERVSWDRYFINIAHEVSNRGTCLRKKVGTVIVRDRNILSTGYNGSVSGAKHCTEIGCWIEENHCIRTVHSECNAIAQAAKNGVSVNGATLYTTLQPCWNCLKLIVNSGIKSIYYSEEYSKSPTVQLAKELGVSFVKL